MNRLAVSEREVVEATQRLAPASRNDVAYGICVARGREPSQSSYVPLRQRLGEVIDMRRFDRVVDALIDSGELVSVRAQKLRQLGVNVGQRSDRTWCLLTARRLAELESSQSRAARAQELARRQRAAERIVLDRHKKEVEAVLRSMASRGDTVAHSCSTDLGSIGIAPEV